MDCGLCLGGEVAKVGLGWGRREQAYKIQGASLSEHPGDRHVEAGVALMPQPGPFEHAWPLSTAPSGAVLNCSCAGLPGMPPMPYQRRPRRAIRGRPRLDLAVLGQGQGGESARLHG